MRVTMLTKWEIFDIILKNRGSITVEELSRIGKIKPGTAYMHLYRLKKLQWLKSDWISRGSHYVKRYTFAKKALSFLKEYGSFLDNPYVFGSSRKWL